MTPPLARAGKREWDVVQEYGDDDTSASRTRENSTAWRGCWEALSGVCHFDVIAARDMDRLLQRLAVLSVLLDSNVRVVAAEGDLDILNEGGASVASMLTAQLEVKDSDT